SVQVAVEHIEAMDESKAIGEKLAGQLNKDKLSHVLVISDGLNVNGSELVAGLNEHLPDQVVVTGGLAGDQDKFEETVVVIDETVESKKVVVVGFYSDSLKIGYGSMGGWDSFGVERSVTKSEGNVLYELD